MELAISLPWLAFVVVAVAVVCYGVGHFHGYTNALNDANRDSWDVT